MNTYLPRRSFLTLGAGLVAMSAGAAGPAAAEVTSKQKEKVLVCLFLRGAADGLSMVVPHQEPAYYQVRSSTAIAPPGNGPDAAVDLDGRFGLHPSLSMLHPFYTSGRLAIVHAVGAPSPTRSHFEAQDAMESGVVGTSRLHDGWLNRSLQVDANPSASVLRGVAMQSSLPRTLHGKAATLSVGALQGFGIRAPRRMRAHVEGAFARLYEGNPGDPVAQAGRNALEAARIVRDVGSNQVGPEHGARYPNQQPGKSLQQLASLIKANVGVKAGFVEVGGWDTHAGQRGRLSRLLRNTGQSLSAFFTDLGDHQNDVVLVAMTEFGRTVAQNGTGGTDHGHGSVMFVMGGSVKGGKVYGDFPGLEESARFEGRDLAITTDYRTVLSEVLMRHWNLQNPASVFPGHTGKLLGVMPG